MTKTGRGAAYRKHAASAVKTKEVELPSGALFLLREPNLEAFVLSGVLPFDLSMKLESLHEKAGGDPNAAFNLLSPEEMEKTVGFERALLMQICADPKIVDEPKEDDEISISDLTKDDMKFLFAWGLSGGGGADLDSFRPQPGTNAVARSDGKKRRKATK